MGQTLSAPVTQKKTERGGNLRYAFAISEMQGWRVSMEDSHTALLKLLEDAKDDEADSFFAVFDGHGGDSVAKYAGENVYKRLAMEESYHEQNYEKALKRSFMGTDEDLRADPSFFRDPSGCTAIAALITSDQRIFVANAGDSRSVLCSAGEAKPLSFDHKPDNQVEYNRIKAAGGYIEGGRVCGNLALSRAIGDFEFKKEYSLEPEAQIITSNPDITEHEITEEDEFLILACDGIWDCLTSQQTVDYIRRSLHKRKTLSEICEDIMDHCCSPDSNGGLGIGMDNMTIMIVAILHGRTLDEWHDWMTERVERSKEVGYATPEQLPQIYSHNRLMLASERQRRLKENPKAYDDDDDDDEDYRPRPLGVGPLGGLARIFSGAGGEGLSFMPSRGISRATSALFADDSSDDDPDGEDLSKWTMDHGDELEDQRFSEELDDVEVDDEGDGERKYKRDRMHMDGSDEDSETTEPTSHDATSAASGSTAATSNHVKPSGEAPPPPPPERRWSNPPVQLTHKPLGDELVPSITVESHLEGSEDPMKAAVSA